MTDSKIRDQVFNKPLSSVKAFEFDDEVTRVFDDMISRSVPGYDLLLKLVALYSDVFVREHSSIYDLGCSTGMVSRIIHQQVRGRQARIHAVDNSASMIRSCREKHQGLDIDWIHGDIQQVRIQAASMVVLNLTLQFVQPAQRSSLLQHIFQGLIPGGILVLTEKVEYSDPGYQREMTGLYHAFKKIQGYSDLEISQKRAALEDVLIPDTRETHIQRLKETGFDQVYDCFHCLNFVSFLAIKSS